MTSVPLKLSKELSVLKQQNLKMPTLAQGQHLLVWRLREPLDYLGRAQASFERKQSIKVQKVNQRSMKRDQINYFVTSGLAYPAVVLFTSREEGLGCRMTSTEGSMARFLRMGSLGHKG